MPDQGKCRSCGAPVIWARHETTGKLAPLEQDDAGTWTIVNGTYYRPARLPALRHRYVSHYARCVNAARHREGQHEPPPAMQLDLEVAAS